MKRGVLCTASALLAAAVSAAAPPQDYAVRLARPAAVGQQQLAVGSLETDDETSGGATGAEPAQHQTATIRYVVATEILEVSPAGNARRATLTVRRLTKESAGVTLELAKPGELLTARLDDRERVVEMRGTPLAPDLEEALAAAAFLRADDDPNDDDLFGTPQRRQVGESWPVHAELFARSGARRVVFDPKQVSGTVTLVGLKSAHGQPCLEVRWKLEARQGSFKPGILPAGLLGTMTAMVVGGSTVVPVDAALQPAARETVIAGNGDFTGTTEAGKPLTIHRRLRQAFHLELSKIP